MVTSWTIPTKENNVWMMTPRGFFSAVAKDPARPDRITVRARDKSDLESLKELIPDARDVPSALWADYPCRVECSIADWATACARMALEVDYSNFKDEVSRVQGKKRSGIYMGVWSRLLDIEGPGRWSARARTWDPFADDDLDLTGLSGQELDDAIDAMPGAKLDAALAEVSERQARSTGKVAPPSQRRKKQSKQSKQPTRRRAPRGRSR